MVILKKTFLIVLIIFGSIGQGLATETRVIPSTDLTYDGSFKLPSLPSGYKWYIQDTSGYYHGGMSFYPPNNSLLVMGGPGSVITQRPWVAEISIPVLKDATTTAYADLNAGTLSHDLVDFMGVDGSSSTVYLGSVHYYEHHGSQSTDKIYMSARGGYISSGIIPLLGGQFAWTENDLDDLDTQGWWNSSPGVTYTGKYIFHAPDGSFEGTSAAGRTLLMGWYRGGGGITWGPTIYAFAPWESCGGDPIDCDTDPPTPGISIPYSTLLQYTSDSTEYSKMANTDLMSNTDKWTDAAWITVGTKRAIVFFGWKQGRNIRQYSYPQAPPYDSSTSEGTHDSPGYPCLYFYDPSDIEAVAAETKQPYEPQPYRIVNLLRYFYQKGGFRQNCDGMAYDESTNKLYIRETSNPNIADQQTIHVFSLTDTGSDLDTASPSAPELILSSASHTSISLSWSTSTDDSGLPVNYVVYRDDLATSYQITTTFTDNVYSYYVSPVKYFIRAVDFEGNYSDSNSVYVDGSNGGNSPLTIFITGIPSVPAQHETSALPLIIQNVAYSYTPTAIGGTPPYTWQGTNFPSGLDINSSTGEIYGTCASLGSAYTPYITVTDSIGNIHRRKTKITVRSSSYKDYDGDGYNSIADGGTDTDDYSINISDLSPTQPVPTSFIYTEYTATTISLNWVAPETDRTLFTSQSGVHYWNLLGKIGYIIHLGTSPGVYTTSIYVGNQTSYMLTGLTEGETYYIALSAIDWYGLESLKTSEINVTLETQAASLNGAAYGAYYAEGWDQTASIVETADGGMIIIGPTWSYAWNYWPGNEVARMMMLKINSSGVEQWRKVIGPEGYDIKSKQNSTLHWIPTKIILSGTDPIICGYRGTSGTDGINGFLMKFDSSGDLVWDKSFNNTTHNDYFMDIVARPAGGFTLTGHGWSGTETGFWMQQVDADGVPISTPYNYYHLVSKGYAAASTIRATSDGGYIMAGYTSTGAAEDEDYYVVKISSDGTPQWQQKYDNSGRRDRATGIEEDASGNFWVFGRSQLSGYENTKIWIVKLNSSGVLQTSYSIGDDVSSHAYVARGSVKLASGNFIVVGYTNVSGASGYHGYVAEISPSDGSVVQSATIGATDGGTEDYLFKVIISADGNYLHIIGTDNGSFTTAYDFWYLKLDKTDLSVENFTECESKTAYYYDKDLDGKGNNNQWTPDTGDCCFAMPGYVLDHTDNDDSNVPKFIFGSGSIMEVGLGGNLAIQ